MPISPCEGYDSPALVPVPWNALEEKPPVRGMEVHAGILPEQDLIFNALIGDYLTRAGTTRGGHQ